MEDESNKGCIITKKDAMALRFLLEINYPIHIMISTSHLQYLWYFPPNSTSSILSHDNNPLQPSSIISFWVVPSSMQPTISIHNTSNTHYVSMPMRYKLKILSPFFEEYKNHGTIMVKDYTILSPCSINQGSSLTHNKPTGIMMVRYCANKETQVRS